MLWVDICPRYDIIGCEVRRRDDCMLSLIERVAPGTIGVLMRRLEILGEIHRSSPIGRRALAQKLNLTERTLRSEVDILRDEKLIRADTTGMRLSDRGQSTMQALAQLLERQTTIQRQETALAEMLGIQSCTIVCRDDEKVDAKEQLADSVVKLVEKLLDNQSQTIGVMGGTTMRSVANAFESRLVDASNVLFVPARGGASDSPDIQPNQIAARMAELTGAKSRTLNAPEHVSAETHSLLLEEPEIKKTLRFLSEAILVIFSIGRAMEMANRFKLKQQDLDKLEEHGAVAEAFGEFLDQDGKVVHKVARIGLSAEQLSEIPNLLAVAGGANKAQAIQAYMKTAPPHTQLVTDQAAAQMILNGEYSL